MTTLFRSVTDVTANADVTVATAITIQPPIVVGSSPGDGADLTISGAKLTAIVLDYSDSAAGPDEFIGGFTITFREAI
jgi:hypothetical protein